MRNEIIGAVVAGLVVWWLTERKAPAAPYYGPDVDPATGERAAPAYAPRAEVYQGPMVNGATGEYTPFYGPNVDPMSGESTIAMAGRNLQHEVPLAMYR